MKHKRFLSILIVLAMCMGLMPSFSLTTYAADADTSWYSDSYTSFTLYDAADLAGLASLVNAGNSFDGKTIVLGNSIDLNNEEWTPIGTSSSYPFNGTFDGNDYTVSNLYINGSSSYQGLFGYVKSGTVQNVTVSGNVTGYEYVGGVAGANHGTVTNCTNSVTISASGSRAGGVVGYNGAGTVANCYNSGSISGIGRLGGVVGYNDGGTVKNCCNSGTVTSTYTGYDYVGGVVGINWGSVTNCCNYGAVSGYTGIGGVVGYNGNAVSSCYNYGAVSGTTNVGGVVGNNSGSNPTNCYYLTGTATA